MTRGGAGTASPQSGYALLALLVSSAILLAMLALAVPRMAMQAQRVKEERLIERGEQYRRAIKLYYRKHGKYPEEIDDLENTDGVRYLRRRHTDPLSDTGEWRLIHMGTDGRFEDSQLYDLARDQDQARRPGGGPLSLGVVQSSTAGVVPTPQAAQAAAQAEFPGPQETQWLDPFDPASRARAARESAAPDLADRDRYDRGFGFGGDEELGANETPGDNVPPDYSRMLPSLVPMNENDPDQRSSAAYQQQLAQAGIDPRRAAGQPGAYPRRAGSAAAQPGTAAAQQEANPGAIASGTSAAGLINRLLTTPRAGGLAGAVNTSAATAARRFERGIAGVASTREGEGVKVYQGMTEYPKWEFVYDYRKDEDARRDNTQAQPPAAEQMRNWQPTKTPGRPVR